MVRFFRDEQTGKFMNVYLILITVAAMSSGIVIVARKRHEQKKKKLRACVVCYSVGVEREHKKLSVPEARWGNIGVALTRTANLVTRVTLKRIGIITLSVVCGCFSIHLNFNLLRSRTSLTLLDCQNSWRVKFPDNFFCSF